MMTKSKKIICIIEDLMKERSQEPLLLFLGKLGTGEIIASDGKPLSFDDLHKALKHEPPKKRQEILNVLYNCTMDIPDKMFDIVFCDMSICEFLSFVNLFQGKKADRLEERLMNVLHIYYDKPVPEEKSNKQDSRSCFDGASTLLSVCGYITGEKIKNGHMTQKEAEQESMDAIQLAETLHKMADLMVERGASREDAVAACIDFACDSGEMSEKEKAAIKTLLLQKNDE